MQALDFAIWSIALPVTIGLVHVCKEAGLPARWAGVAAVVAGVGIGPLIRLAGIGDGPLALAMLTGAVAGLSAAGTWSTARAAADRSS
jgi:hypothetical protein